MKYEITIEFPNEPPQVVPFEYVRNENDPYAERAAAVIARKIRSLSARHPRAKVSWREVGA